MGLIKKEIKKLTWAISIQENRGHRASMKSEFQEMPELRERIRALSGRKIWPPVRDILLTWGTIAMALWVAHRFELTRIGTLVWIICGVVIATRQLALGILMHEQSHRGLFANQKWNMIISNLFFSYPLGLSTRLYRRSHGPHHEAPSTSFDPTYKIQKLDPGFGKEKTKTQMIRMLILDGIGVNGPKIMFAAWALWSPFPRLFVPSVSKIGGLSKFEKFDFIAFWALAFSLIAYFGLFKEFFFLWMVPYLTLLMLMLRMRGLLEHPATPHAKLIESTFHVDLNWVERFFFAPMNSHYHLAHHLFAGVPYYHLNQLHEILMKEKAYEVYGARFKGITNLEKGVLWTHLEAPKLGRAG